MQRLYTPNVCPRVCPPPAISNEHLGTDLDLGLAVACVEMGHLGHFALWERYLLTEQPLVSFHKSGEAANESDRST